MKSGILWFCLLVLALAAVGLGYAFITTTPVVLKPRLSSGATFRVLNEGIDSSWYEIDLGEASRLPISVDAEYIPSRPYFFHLIFTPSPGDRCEEMAARELSSLVVKVRSLRDGSEQSQTIRSWMGSDQAVAAVTLGVARGTCVLSAKPAEPIHFSKFGQYKIEVLATNEIDSKLQGARVVLGSQG